MKFGITQTFSCSYLPDKEEQLLVYVGDDEACANNYPQLIQAGFRRSGSQVYRPYCQQCSACHSIRIPVAEFAPSRSQRRILNKNSSFSISTSREPAPTYYPLYERYINERHADGTMFPPSPAQFEGFLECQWNTPLFVEAYDGDKLIGVAVTDIIDGIDGHEGYSAMYTFYDPDYAEKSLGTWMILRQIQFTQTQNKHYLYLGYQIDACNKMNYKNRFFPHERHAGHEWHKINDPKQAENFALHHANLIQMRLR